MRLHANCIIVHYRITVTVHSGIIVPILTGFQSLKPIDFEQVKAGVALGASPQITSDGRADRFADIRDCA